MLKLLKYDFRRERDNILAMFAVADAGYRCSEGIAR